MKTKASPRRSRQPAANDKRPEDLLVALLTKAEIAKHLRFTTRTVEHWLTKGLPHLRLGNRATRFRVRDVEDFFAAQYGDINGTDSTPKRGRSSKLIAA